MSRPPEHADEVLVVLVGEGPAARVHVVDVRGPRVTLWSAPPGEALWLGTRLVDEARRGGAAAVPR